MDKSKYIDINESAKWLMLEIENATTIDEILDGFITFYNKYKFEHSSDALDADMLLYQANLNNLPGYNRFELNITRQIEMSKDDEFFQLGIDIIYDKTFFKAIDTISIWSHDFQSIEEWANFVKNEDSFHVGRNVEYLQAEVSLSET